MKQKYITGDWVSWLGTRFKIDGVIVDPNTKDKDYYSIADTGSKSVFKEGSLKPIPLTPKILEKNGWEKEVTHLSLKNVVSAYTLSDTEDFGYFPILLVEEYNGTFVVYPFTDGNICKPIAYIKYVSDLQHLLFGLGLDSNIKL